MRALADAVVEEDVPAGEALISEGEGHGDAFVLLSGAVQVITTNALGQLVPLRHIKEPGALFGEQALLAGREARSASVIVAQDARIGRVPGDMLRTLILDDEQARGVLEREGLKQARSKLAALSAVLADAFPDPAAGATQRRQLREGQILYRKGELADAAYVLLSGHIALVGDQYAPLDSSIGAGEIFGAQGVVEAAPRSVTTKALSDAEVLRVDADAFRAAVAQSEPLGASVAALRRVYDVPGVGAAYRYTVTVDGEPCVTTDYTLASGQRMVVRTFSHRNLVAASMVTGGDTTTATIGSHAAEVALTVSEPGDLVVGVSAPQDWAHLPEAIGLVLRHQKLERWQKEAFVARGVLLLEGAAGRAHAGRGIECVCTNVSAAHLRAVIATGVTDVRTLSERTGAGTVCGGCRGRLKALIGRSDYMLFTLRRLPLASDAAAVRLMPVSGQVPRARPGQYITIEALVDGAWIGRPYTLTWMGPGAYEIGVKRERLGLFSNWILDAEPDALVRTSVPDGELCPDPADPRPLVYVVAGIGVTPAIAAMRALAKARRLHIVYSFRRAEDAAYLGELREAAQVQAIALTEVETSTQGRRIAEATRAIVARLGACEIVVCGPREFNADLVRALKDAVNAEIRLESFVRADAEPIERKGAPGTWRSKDFCPVHPGGEPVPLKTDLPSDAQAERFLRQFFVEQGNDDEFPRRWREVRAEFDETGTYRATFAELEFAARVAWRNAVRCIGRFYWQGLTVRDRRHLAHPDDVAQALFEHLEYAFNDGNIRPTITVLDPGMPVQPGPRIWNPQLVRYAGYRGPRRKIIGDPAQLEVTERIMQLGWQGGGGRFDVLPLVIACPGRRPRWYEVPKDLVHEVPIAHPDYPWLARMELRWYSVPAVADMALDAGGILYRFAPFSGWYMGTEIAARNFTDTNRYDLLPEIAERIGLDTSSDRTLWRDKAMIMLNEAVLLSYDRAGVKMADHHEAGHEFLDFCRAEQSLGREPYGKWMWLVPPISGSGTPLYQEPFRDISIKPAYRYQEPAWKE